jgi:hypothetical protein
MSRLLLGCLGLDARLGVCDPLIRGLAVIKTAVAHCSIPPLGTLAKMTSNQPQQKGFPMGNAVLATRKVATKTRRKAVEVKVDSAKPEPIRIAGLEAKSGDAVAALTMSLTMLKMAYEAANNEAGSWRVLKDTPKNRDKVANGKKIRTAETWSLSGGKALDAYNQLRAAKKSHKVALDIVTQMFKAKKALANRFADEIKTLEYQQKQGTAVLAK